MGSHHTGSLDGNTASVPQFKMNHDEIPAVEVKVNPTCTQKHFSTAQTKTPLSTGTVPCCAVVYIP